LPRGDADRTRTVQLDIERYLTPRDFVKLFLFDTRARGLGLGGTGNLAAPFAPAINLPVARRTGVGVRYERQLNSNLFAAVSLIANRTTNNSPGQIYDREIAPYQPEQIAGLTLNYIDPRGNKVKLDLNYQSSFFQDSPLLTGQSNRPHYPGRLTVDLRLAKEPTVQNEYFVQVTNLFNTRQIAFNNFSAGRRRIAVGVTSRF
jgi:hypothetical protein